MVTQTDGTRRLLADIFQATEPQCREDIIEALRAANLLLATGMYRRGYINDGLSAVHCAPLADLSVRSVWPDAPDANQTTRPYCAWEVALGICPVCGLVAVEPDDSSY